MSDELAKGPMEENEKKTIKPLPEPDKPYEDMTPEELIARMKLERMHTLEELGAPIEMLDKWKDAFKRLGTILVGDDVFIYRPLKRIEKRTLTKKSLAHQEIWRRDLDFTEEVAGTCTLHPELTVLNLRNELPDGVVEELANAIMSLSGHGASATIVEL
jgi:hypothetical protein